VRSIQILKEVVKEEFASAGFSDVGLIDEPFEYLARELAEKNI
jgi:phycobilisome core component